MSNAVVFVLTEYMPNFILFSSVTFMKIGVIVYIIGETGD